MVTVTAALNGLSQTAQVSIGIVPLTSLTCAPSTLTAGTSPHLQLHVSKCSPGRW